MNKKPEFLCIGAKKAGTTWFHQNLRKHPDLWLPPVKELHYFDTVALPWYRALRRVLYRLRRRPSRLRLLWRRPRLWKWICCPLWDSWYLSLFSESGERLAGEITPAYGTLADAQVARVHRLLPEAKIFFLARDPVERCWSQLRKSGQTDSSMPRSVHSLLRAPDTRLHSHYPEILRRWQRYYPLAQMKVLFFDELVQAPDQLMRQAFQFLGVDPEVRLWGLRKPANQGPRSECPGPVLRHLAEYFHNDIEEMCQLYPGWPEQWRERNLKRLQ